MELMTLKVFSGLDNSMILRSFSGYLFMWMFLYFVFPCEIPHFQEAAPVYSGIPIPADQGSDKHPKLEFIKPKLELSKHKSASFCCFLLVFP